MLHTTTSTWVARHWRSKLKRPVLTRSLRCFTSLASLPTANSVTNLPMGKTTTPPLTRASQSFVIPKMNIPHVRADWTCSAHCNPPCAVWSSWVSRRNPTTTVSTPPPTTSSFCVPIAQVCMLPLNAAERGLRHKHLSSSNAGHVRCRPSRPSHTSRPNSSPLRQACNTSSARSVAASRSPGTRGLSC